MARTKKLTEEVQNDMLTSGNTEATQLTGDAAETASSQPDTAAVDAATDTQADQEKKEGLSEAPASASTEPGTPEESSALVMPDSGEAPAAPAPDEPEAPKLQSKASRKIGGTKKEKGESPAEAGAPVEEPSAKTSKAPRKKQATPVLTIESGGEIETQEDREDLAWHEVQNAYRTKKILTGVLGGIEKTETDKTIAVVYYKEFRVVIPMSEMMINPVEDDRHNYGELMLRQTKILGNMLGAEIDFIVKGIDSKARGIVASRKEAMLKKRQIFYMGTDPSGMYRIYEDRIVQARVIAVADKVIRVEVFGVECSILARDLTWDWLGDAHERFSVGDQILVRILSVKRDSLETISIKADVKSVAGNTSRDNLKKCRVQGKYAGKVTDIHKGTVFVRLSIGVNAIAHSCYDNRTPGKKDDVSFAVTHIDEERNVAVGIITRIIRQNI